jgi:hypothetical protein
MIYNTAETALVYLVSNGKQKKLPLNAKTHRFETRSFPDSLVVYPGDLPSMSLIPFAPFTDFAQVQSEMDFVPPICDDLC